MCYDYSNLTYYLLQIDLDGNLNEWKKKKLDFLDESREEEQKKYIEFCFVLIVNESLKKVYWKKWPGISLLVLYCNKSYWPINT